MQFQRENEILWKNPLPNGIAYTPPVSLARTIEDRAVLENELLPVFDILRQLYLAESVVNGQSVNVVQKTECSMIDGKMVSLLQGDSGTFYHLCTIHRSDANDMDISLYRVLLSTKITTLVSKLGKNFKMVKLHTAAQRDMDNVMNLLLKQIYTSFLYCTLHYAHWTSYKKSCTTSSRS